MSVKMKHPVRNLKVHYTKDYSKFKKIYTNRSLKSGILSKIEKSMISKGLMVVPIHINENWEVIDGQHRLHISEKLGLGIYYIKIEGIGKDEMITQNSTGGQWNLQDFLDTYVKERNPNYIKIQKFMFEFPMFSITDTCVFLNGGNQTIKGEDFRNGKYVAGSLNTAKELATEIMKLKSVYPLGYTRTIFVRTLLSVNVNNPKFDMGEFVKKSKVVPNEYFQIKGDRKGYKRMIEDIYNYKRRNVDKITIKV